MNKVNVAIIDSGININNKYLSKYTIKGKSFIFDVDTENIVEDEDIQDYHGHGTACAYTILSRNENITIMPIKVVDKLGKTNSKCLLRALEYLKETDVKLINISLSTINLNYEEEFLKVCNELVLRGKIIVSSMDNRYIESLPAKLQCVIGVRGENLGFTDEYLYNDKKSIQCICDNEPIIVPGLKEKELVFFKNNSKATVIMTANISKVLNRNNKLVYDDINNILKQKTVRDSWINEDLNKLKCRISIKEDKDTYIEKINIVYDLIKDIYKSEKLDKEFLYNNPLFNEVTKMDKHNFYELIYCMEKKLNRKINYNKISRKDFDSIYSFLDAISI